MPTLVKSKQTKWDRLARAFIEDIYKERKIGDGKRRLGAHIRRTAAWVGFIVEGIHSLEPTDCMRYGLWQLIFKTDEQWYKVKYNHHKTEAGFKGGVEILEFDPPSRRNGVRVTLICCNRDAARFYNRCCLGKWPTAQVS